MQKYKTVRQVVWIPYDVMAIIIEKAMKENRAANQIILDYVLKGLKFDEEVVTCPACGEKLSNYTRFKTHLTLSQNEKCLNKMKEFMDEVLREKEEALKRLEA